MRDLIIFVLSVGPGAFLVAALLAFALGSGPRPMLIGAGAGLLAIVACGVTLAYVAVPETGCETCHETFGATADRLVLLILLPLNVLGWVAGTTVGWAGREVRRGTGRRQARL